MSDEKKDMTRIEDLSEFLHESDPEVDAQLDETEDTETKTDIDSLDDDTGITDFSDSDDSDSDSDEFSSEGDGGDEFAVPEDDENEFSSDSDDEADFSSGDEDSEFNVEIESEDQEEELTDFASDESEDDSDDFSSDESETFDNESESTSMDFADDESSIENDSFDDSDDSIENDFSTDEESDDSSSDFAEESLEGDLEEVSEFDSPENTSDDVGESLDSFSSEDSLDSLDTMETSNETDGPDDGLDGLEDSSESENMTLSEDDGDDFGSIEENVGNESIPMTAMPTISEAPSSPTPPVERENFEDVKKFGMAINHGTISAGGNPPFSLVLRNIQFREDAEEIKNILQEHGLLNDESSGDIEQGINNGSLLISQISEYAAIVLTHKFRKLSVDIQVGLSQEIHQSPHYEHEETGMVSKYNLDQNKESALNLKNSAFTPHEIILTTTPSLENYHIERYINIVSEHTLVDENLLESLSEETFEQDKEKIDQRNVETIGLDEDDENKLLEDYALGLNEIYHQLADKLKMKAVRLKGNAVIGVNYNITPFIGQSEEGTSTRYKIVCIGNVVLVSQEAQ